MNMVRQVVILAASFFIILTTTSFDVAFGLHTDEPQVIYAAIEEAL
jgi:hypothetical protein